MLLHLLKCFPCCSYLRVCACMSVCTLLQWIPLKVFRTLFVFSEWMRWERTFFSIWELVILGAHAPPHELGFLFYFFRCVASYISHLIQITLFCSDAFFNTLFFFIKKKLVKYFIYLVSMTLPKYCLCFGTFRSYDLIL